MSENQEPSQASTENSNEKQIQFKGVISTFIRHRSFGFIKSTNEEKTKTKGKEIFFHKTEISKSKFNPKIKQGDKCLFDMAQGDKGMIATNIVIYYRPISKLEHKNKHINRVQDEQDSKAALFTSTMLRLFNESVRAKN